MKIFSTFYANVCKDVIYNLRGGVGKISPNYG